MLRHGGLPPWILWGARMKVQGSFPMAVEQGSIPSKQANENLGIRDLSRFQLIAFSERPYTHQVTLVSAAGWRHHCIS